MSKIGLGVLGWAHGHVQTYAGLLVDSEEAQLLRAWDHDPQRGADCAEKFGGVYSPDLADTLNDPAVQLVIVGAETNRHPEVCIAAAEAGKDIILQKPMALSLAGCEAIVEAVERTGVYFSVAYQMRYDPCNLRMKQMCEEGLVGRVGLVRRRHCLSLLFNESFFKGLTAWHVDPEQNLGMFMDDASHAADWLQWMLGRPLTVMAEVGSLMTEVVFDETGVALYRFEGGALGILLNSSAVWAAESTTEIYGTRGVLIQNHGDGPSTAVLPEHPVHLKYYDSEKAEAGWQDQGLTVPPGHGVRIQNVIGNMLREYKAGVQQVPAREGQVSVEMILAAYESAREGQRVAVG
jgi:predicted dehydrogenase